MRCLGRGAVGRRRGRRENGPSEIQGELEILWVAAADFSLEGVVEAVAGIFGERSRFGIAKNVDGLFRGVHDYAAILALHQVLLDFGSKRGVDALVEVIGKFGEDFRALHDASPCRK